MLFSGCFWGMACAPRPPTLDMATVCWYTECLLTCIQYLVVTQVNIFMTSMTSLEVIHTLYGLLIMLPMAVRGGLGCGRPCYVRLPVWYFIITHTKNCIVKPRTTHICTYVCDIRTCPFQACTWGRHFPLPTCWPGDAAENTTELSTVPCWPPFRNVRLIGWVGWRRPDTGEVGAS